MLLPYMTNAELADAIEAARQALLEPYLSCRDKKDKRDLWIAHLENLLAAQVQRANTVIDTVTDDDYRGE